MIDKKLVKKNFNKNLDNYDENAVIQKKMANKLFSFLPGKSYERVLEIGIGTGIFTKILVEKIQFNEFIANDIVSKCDKYLFKIIDNAMFLRGDIEEILIPEKLDLVASNASFQWIENFSFLSKKIASSLNENGVLLFSTFGKNNFIEMREIANVGLNYLSKEEIKNILGENFSDISTLEEKKTIYFESFKDLIHHIKNTGVNSVTSSKMTISELKKFEKKYIDKYKTEKGIALTYNPIYVYAKK